MGDFESGKQLFDSDDESDNEKDKERRFKINVRYAEKYQSRKQQEELRRFRFEEGNHSDSDNSSTDEDEDGEMLTEKLAVDIMKTVNAVRNKDASIYNPQARFFDDDDGDSSDKQRPKRHKPKRFKDVLREQVLEDIKGEREAKSNDDSDDIIENNALSGKTAMLAYDAEQQELRKAFMDSSNGNDNSGAEDDDSENENWMVVKKRHSPSSVKGKQKDSMEKKQAYLEEIRRMEESRSADGDRKNLVDPRGEVKDGEKYLLEYFKNRTWIQKQETDDEIDDVSDNDDDGNDDSDTSLCHLEAADDFEAKYNFRFEQAVAEAETKSGADQSMMGYARGQTIKTLRRKDDSRREKRLARKERKATERKAKEEQLRRLKNAKQQEMKKKLKLIRLVAGDTGQLDADTIDETAMMKLLEGDYDPEKFESIMQEFYGDDFYLQQDAEWKSDHDVKRSLLESSADDHDVADMILLEEGEDAAVACDGEAGCGDQQDRHNVENVGEGNDEGGHDWQDAEHDDTNRYPEEESSDLVNKIESKMKEELYKLDYEDIVAGMPTRFKYKQVEANNYGLSTEEILLARDSTLKQYVSLKNMAPYHEKEYFVGSKKRRRFRDILKHDLEEAEKTGESHQQQEENVKDLESHDEAATAKEPSKRRKRKRQKKGKNMGNYDVAVNDGLSSTTRKQENAIDSDPTPTNQDIERVDDFPAELKTEKLKSKPKRRRKNKAKGATKSDCKTKAMTEERVAAKPNEMGGSPTVESTLVPVVGQVPLEEKMEPVEKKKHKKKRQKKKKKYHSVEGISKARLASYGLT